MKREFDVFGQPVKLLVRSEETGGAFSVGWQTCAPGTGVPPHFHSHEDEVFSVVSGRFEIFEGETWSEMPADGFVLAQRGKVHCFRNCGGTDGTIQFICGGAQFDTFLEGLSQYAMPEQMQEVVDYSARFGIFYPTLPPPSTGKAGEIAAVRERAGNGLAR